MYIFDIVDRGTEISDLNSVVLYLRYIYNRGREYEYYYYCFLLSELLERTTFRFHSIVKASKNGHGEIVDLLISIRIDVDSNILRPALASIIVIALLKLRYLCYIYLLCTQQFLASARRKRVKYIPTVDSARSFLFRLIIVDRQPFTI
jgi:hypothetical protein